MFEIWSRLSVAEGVVVFFNSSLLECSRLLLPNKSQVGRRKTSQRRTSTWLELDEDLGRLQAGSFAWFQNKADGCPSRGLKRLAPT